MKAIIWGFDNSLTYSVIEKMQNDGIIEVTEWFGTPESPHAARTTLDWMDVLRFSEKFSFELCPNDIAAYVQTHMETILDLFSRNFLFQHSPYYEYVNATHFLMAYFYNLISKEKVELILMDDIPHGPGNYILYLIAKKMGIKVLMLVSSYFENCFYYMKDIEDFGFFNQVPPYRTKIENVKIDKKFEKNYWYYEGVGWERKYRPKLSVKQKLNKKALKLKQSMAKYDGIQEMFFLRCAHRIVEKQWNSAYKKNNQSLFRGEIEKGCKFVYFPLHLQPEMTTSILGGKYANQLLALEHLASIIPETWKIYVKEYPGQNYFMRDKYFFRRIALNPKVVLLKSGMDTYELMRHSQFVATLVGTAGWEAVSGGKNVLIFGDAWYRTFPGVFEFKNGVTIEEIENYSISHELLEEKVSHLLLKTGDAMISPDYLALVKGEFDVQVNAERLYKFLEWMLPQL